MQATPSTQPDTGHLTLTGATKDIYNGFKMGTGGIRAAGAVIGFALGFVQLLALLFASWGTCFTRERIGFIPLLLQAGLGLPLLALLTLTFQFDWARYTMLAWTLAATIAYCVHLERAVRRFFKPGREYVNTRSMGRPNPLVCRIWGYLAESDKIEPIHVALCLETALFAMAAYGVGLLEWTLFHYAGVPLSGVSLLLLFTSIGIFAQAAVIWLRDRWALMKLLDDMEGQSAVETALAKHPSLGAAREIEGVASIGEGLYAGGRS